MRVSEGSEGRHAAQEEAGLAQAAPSASAGGSRHAVVLLVLQPLPEVGFLLNKLRQPNTMHESLSSLCSAKVHHKQ